MSRIITFYDNTFSVRVHFQEREILHFTSTTSTDNFGSHKITFEINFKEY